MALSTRIVITGQDRGGSAAFRNLGKSATQSQRQIFGANRAIKQTDKSVKSLGFSLKTLVGAGGSLFLLNSAFNQIRRATDIQIGFDRINNTLRAVTGSTEEAADEMGFLTMEAERLGLQLRPLATTYTKLLASTRLIGIGTEETREIFTGFSEALTTFGASREQSTRVFQALEQIAAKGVVSMEELRQQLGEALPGSLTLAARAVGKTEKEFIKLVSQGEILAKDFLVPFAREVRQTLGTGAVTGAQLLERQLDRLTNTGERLFLAFSEGRGGRGGFTQGFAEGLIDLREALEDGDLEQSVAKLGRELGQAFANGTKLLIGFTQALRGLLDVVGSPGFNDILTLLAARGALGAGSRLLGGGGGGATAVAGGLSAFEIFRQRAAGSNIGISQKASTPNVLARLSTSIAKTIGPLNAFAAALAAGALIGRKFVQAQEDRILAEEVVNRESETQLQLRRIGRLQSGIRGADGVDDRRIQLEIAISQLTRNLETFRQRNDPAQQGAIEVTEKFIALNKERLAEIAQSNKSIRAVNEAVQEVARTYEITKSEQNQYNRFIRQLGIEISGPIKQFAENLFKSGQSIPQVIEAIRQDAEAAERTRIQEAGRARRRQNALEQRNFESKVAQDLRQTERELEIRRNFSERGASAQIAYENSIRQAAEAGRTLTDETRRQIARIALLNSGSPGGTTAFGAVPTLQATQGARARALQSGITRSGQNQDPTKRQIDTLIQNQKKAEQSQKEMASAMTSIDNTLNDFSVRFS